MTVVRDMLANMSRKLALSYVNDLPPPPWEGEEEEGGDGEKRRTKYI